MKKHRIVDRDLLDQVKQMPCIACGTRPVDPHHVTTVKAGGDDVDTNVVPVCRIHHQEWHARGPGHMMQKFPAVHLWLLAAGRYDVIARAKR